MDIKKLSKEITDEGITLESVNSPLFLKRYSPAILRAGEEQVTLLCINGRENSLRFWIRDRDKNWIKDSRKHGGRLLVIDEEEARIGRARYLVLHGEEERKAEQEKFFASVEKQAEKWKAEIDRGIKTFHYDLQVNKCIAGEEFEDTRNEIFTVAAYAELLKRDKSDFELDIMKSSAKAKLPESEELYEHISEMQTAGDWYGLAKMLGKVGNDYGEPIFIAHYDNPEEMDNLKSIFGKDAMDYFGGDMLKISAAIHIKKQQMQKIQSTEVG
jgi:hypothetical protein